MVQEPAPPPPLLGRGTPIQTEAPEEPAPAPSGPAIDRAAIDAALADTICTVLSWSAGEDGKVLLWGRVPSEAARSNLTARIEALPGVNGVEDETIIHPAPDCEAVQRIGP